MLSPIARVTECVSSLHTSYTTHHMTHDACVKIRGSVVSSSFFFAPTAGGRSWKNKTKSMLLTIFGGGSLAFGRAWRLLCFIYPVVYCMHCFRFGHIPCFFLPAQQCVLPLHSYISIGALFLYYYLSEPSSCGFRERGLLRGTIHIYIHTHDVIYFPASGQAVVTGVVPSSPRFLPSIFVAHRVQQSHYSSTFHRVLSVANSRSRAFRVYVRCCCCSHINSHNQVRGHRTGSSHSGAEENPREKHTQPKVVHAYITADAIHASTRNI